VKTAGHAVLRENRATGSIRKNNKTDRPMARVAALTDRLDAARRQAFKRFLVGVPKPDYSRNFNGAAVFRLRKYSWGAAIDLDPDKLQRGRSLSTAEIVDAANAAGLTP